MKKLDKVEELYTLVKDIEIAMFTTRRDDGRLVSRPMATQKQASGADFWFVTSRETEKLDELEAEPNVNLGYYDPKTREYVSVSGRARIVTDRAKVRELYAPDWKAWFPGDDEKSGTPEDPRIVLIGVDVDSAVFLVADKSRPVQAFEFVKGMVTGSTPDIGRVEKVGAADMA